LAQAPEAVKAKREFFTAMNAKNAKETQCKFLLIVFFIFALFASLR